MSVAGSRSGDHGRMLASSPDRVRRRGRLAIFRVFAAPMGCWRYLALMVLFNLPCNSMLGGGGIALAAGMSGLFSFPRSVGTVLIAIAPVPLSVGCADISPTRGESDKPAPAATASISIFSSCGRYIRKAQPQSPFSPTGGESEKPEAAPQPQCPFSPLVGEMSRRDREGYQEKNPCSWRKIAKWRSRILFDFQPCTNPFNSI